MKKFIVVAMLMLVTFVSNAQYNNQYIRQENATPAQWNEWKGLMSQYNTSKGIIYGGLAVGTIGTTTFALLRNANMAKINAGEEIANIGEGSATVNRQALNTCYTVGMYAFAVGGVGAVIWGFIKKNDARRKLDRFYFNNGFVYTF